MYPKPTLGRIVHVHFYDERYNGSEVHPAIVTAAWSDETINCRVVVDGNDNPIWLTSIQRKDLVDAQREKMAADGLTPSFRAAWLWPPRE